MTPTQIHPVTKSVRRKLQRMINTNHQPHKRLIALRWNATGFGITTRWDPYAQRTIAEYGGWK